MPANNVLNANDPASIEKAAQVLKTGGIVAFPTETVYGLGADASNPLAVAKVFEAKKRPQFDPIIVHVASVDEALPLWQNTPKVALELMKRFWPGPLTLVLPKTDRIPDIVTAGLPTVAVRMPENKIALKLIQLLERPIAAPSANVFGYTSSTTAEAVSEDFGDKVDLILDAGATRIGIESTVLKIEKDHGVLLRPGGAAMEAIEKIIHVVKHSGQAKEIVESPGQMQSHYAPWTNFSLMGSPFGDFVDELRGIQKLFQQKKVNWPRIGLLVFGRRDLLKTEEGMHLFEIVEDLSPSKDLREAAANLFQSLRKLDKMNLDILIAEAIPERDLGLAIMDRLRKAAASHVEIREYLKNLMERA